MSSSLGNLLHSSKVVDTSNLAEAHYTIRRKQDDSGKFAELLPVQGYDRDAKPCSLRKTTSGNVRIMAQQWPLADWGTHPQAKFGADVIELLQAESPVPSPTR